jgi:transposase
METNWNERKYFGALDWASDHHDVAVVDKTGAIVFKSRIQHTIAGWQDLRQQLKAFSPVAIAVETNQGMAVEQLLAAGYEVYPVNPKSAQRYRDRKSPSGVKDDERDAWSLADALRMDGHGWRKLLPDDPLVAELRLLTRDEVTLIQQRSGLVSQLRAALRDYYPAALEAFDDWTVAYAWKFIETFPTPDILEKAGKAKWAKFLRAHHVWREGTAERRLAIFAQATALQGASATVAAKSLLAVTLAKLLGTLEAQLDAYRARIEERFNQHPDRDLFGSLPGAGPKLAPRLLGEIGDERARFDSAEGLQAYAGTAPVTFQSGQIERHLVRRACDPLLRAAVHHWANLSRKKCAWAQAYYHAHREKGQSHACALRCLGQRWLKILWKMWQTHSLYDEAFHTRNQLKHGSWLLSLQQPQNP